MGCVTRNNETKRVSTTPEGSGELEKERQGDEIVSSDRENWTNEERIKTEMEGGTRMVKKRGRDGRRERRRKRAWN